MKTKIFNKIGIAIVGFMAIAQLSVANDKLPLLNSAEDQKAIAELVNQLRKMEAQQVLFSSIESSVKQIKVVDTEGKVIQQASFVNQPDWSEAPELRNLIGRSSFMMEFGNTIYYVFDQEVSEKSIS